MVLYAFKPDSTYPGGLKLLLREFDEWLSYPPSSDEEAEFEAESSRKDSLLNRHRVADNSVPTFQLSIEMQYGEGIRYEAITTLVNDSKNKYALMMMNHGGAGRKPTYKFVKLERENC